MSERALWLSTLLIGLSDVAQGRDRHWMYSRDFDLVCHLAEAGENGAGKPFTQFRKFAE